MQWEQILGEIHTYLFVAQLRWFYFTLVSLEIALVFLIQTYVYKEKDVSLGAAGGE